MEKFLAFQLLPFELRTAIWTLFPPSNRILKREYGSERWRIIPHVLTVPPLLHTCHESRMAWIKKYHMLDHGASGVQFVSYDHDVLLVPSLTPQPNYFGVFFVSRIRHIGWTNAFLHSDLDLEPCYKLLPSFQSFSLVLESKYPTNTGALTWIEIRNTSSASGAAQIFYLLVNPSSLQ